MSVFCNILHIAVCTVFHEFKMLDRHKYFLYCIENNFVRWIATVYGKVWEEVKMLAIMYRICTLSFCQSVFGQDTQSKFVCADLHFEWTPLPVVSEPNVCKWINVDMLCKALLVVNRVQKCCMYAVHLPFCFTSLLYKNPNHHTYNYDHHNLHRCI